MRVQPLWLGVVFLVLGGLPAQAADLSKIERVIAKEPKYEAKPAYCLLVFGLEAKFRVWLVLDGTVLYVDRNGNGDLTERDERVPAHYQKGQRFGFKPGRIETPDGKSQYDLEQVRRHEEGHLDLSLPCGNQGYARAGFDGPGRLHFADRAQDAPIIHFQGPLTLHRFEPQPRSASAELKPEPLVPGQRRQLAFSLGTPGLGSGAFAKYPVDERLTAVAELRFAGGKTISVPLTADC